MRGGETPPSTEQGTRCAGAILAGGRATRFAGRPKGLEVVQGRRILDRVADALRPLTDELLLVANDAAASTWLPGARVVGDVRRDEGSLGGLHAALYHSRSAVLAVAWDMPFVSGPLLARVRALGAGVDAVLPWSPGPRGMEPVCAWYAPSCLPAIERRLDAGDLAMVSALEELRVYIVPEHEVRTFGDPDVMFLNVNSEADLRRAERVDGAGT